ncbi:recombinase family protein [Wolbachia endosymbiont (group E) of Neria commutata]|uniref:recombinase family protein n=1 Tax=Wolbachia endosymbiont (group E) of Neria commutata TaxID=3066149 RepID=UPI003132E502
MGGSVPLGYDAKDKKLVINEEEAEVVKHIFKRFIELKSMTLLTKELNSQGYRTKIRLCKSGRQGSGLFGTAAVRAIITNLTYIGKVKHKDKCCLGIHKAIIEEDVWNKAQTLIEKRPNYKEKYEEGILKGIIRCQLCNASMIPTYTKKPNKLYRYYVCDNQVERKLCPSMKRRISAGEVERIVIEKRGMLTLLEVQGY